MILRLIIGAVLTTSCLSCSVLGKNLFGSSYNSDSRASLNLTNSGFSTNSKIGSGSITIVKQVPLMTDSLSTLDQQIFALKNHKGSAVIIDRLARTIELKKDNKTIHKIEDVENLGRLDGGKYSVAEKQRQPLWYAPDYYFTRRKMPVPSQSDESRLLRGALGDYALFLSNDTTLHNSPLWTSEVGGIKLDEQELTKLYYQLEVGTPVIIN